MLPARIQRNVSAIPTPHKTSAMSLGLSLIGRLMRAQARFALHAWAAPVLVAAAGGALAVHFTSLPAGAADLGAHLATFSGVAIMLAIPGASAQPSKEAASYDVSPA